jgi:hypothetical protein
MARATALSGKKKPAKGRKPAKPKQTPAQRAEARTAQRQTNIDNVAKQMADNDTGLSPSGSKALTAFAQGKQPDAAMGKQLAQMGLAEQASDGSFRMTPTGRGVVSAMAAGDYQRAVDGISRGGDTSAKRQERTSAAQTRQAGAAKRQQDAAGKRLANQLGRELAKRQPKPAKAASGGSKKPAAHEQAPEKPRAPAKPKRAARQSAPSVGSVGRVERKAEARRAQARTRKADRARASDSRRPTQPGRRAERRRHAGVDPQRAGQAQQGRRAGADGGGYARHTESLPRLQGRAGPRPLGRAVVNGIPGPRPRDCQHQGAGRRLRPR